MNEQELLAARFEQHRSRLRAIAHRMLGSASEADDAVQEAWLRLSRSDVEAVRDLEGWLTTVVGRICLDVLRAQTRRNALLDPHLPDPIVVPADSPDPEEQTVLADSVGLALLIVLDELTPAERLALVLHDVFDVPFEQVAQIVGCSQQAARQLASRARRRIRRADVPDAGLDAQWRLVDAFLAAAQAGDFDALLRVLDPDVVRRLDSGEIDLGVPRILRGAEAVAAGAAGFRTLGGEGRRVLVNGAPGVVTFVDGQPFAVVAFTVARGRIVELNVLADPARVRRLA